MAEFGESQSPIHTKSAEEKTDVELTANGKSKALNRSNSCNQEEIDALRKKIHAYNAQDYTPQYEKITESTLDQLDEQEVDEVTIGHGLLGCSWVGGRVRVYVCVCSY